MIEIREEVRCLKCLLNQFMTSNRLCRRCHKPLDLSEPVEIEPIMMNQPTEKKFKPVSFDRQISARIRELRRFRRMSQSQLAAIMDCPRSYISKLETGRVNPLLRTLQRLSDAFQITVYELMLTQQEIRRQNFLADPFIAALAADLPKLSPERRKEVLRFAGLLESQSKVRA